MHPKVHSVAAKFSAGTNNTWLAFHANEHFSHLKQRFINLSKKLWQHNVAHVTEEVGIVSTPVRQSLLQKQNFRTTIKGIASRTQCRGRYGLMFNSEVFGKGFISKRLKYSHLLAFSTLILAKEEAFNRFEEEEIEISIYDKVCRNLKDILRPSAPAATADDCSHSINDFDIEKLIAVGSNAVVFEASQKKCDKSVENLKSADSKEDLIKTNEGQPLKKAIKMVYNFCSSNHSAIRRMVESELVISQQRTLTAAKEWQIRKHSRMKTLPRHNNLLHIEAAIIDKVPLNLPNQEKYSVVMPHSTPCGKGRKNTMFLVTKRYPQTLEQVIRRGLNPTEKQLLCLQLLQGVAHLERHFIVHRDLKSDNIFVEYDASGLPRLVIGDFGCCLQGNCRNDLLVPFYHDIRDGTPCIQAPEIKDAVEGVGNFIDYRKSDLWGVGGLVSEILSGENPLMTKNYDVQQMKDLSYCWRWLVTQLLNSDKDCRPSAVLAANVIYLEMFGPTKSENKTCVDWLELHAAEYVIYRNEKWGGDSVMCDIFFNFLTTISCDELRHSLKIWSQLSC